MFLTNPFRKVSKACVWSRQKLVFEVAKSPKAASSMINLLLDEMGGGVLKKAASSMINL